MSIMPERTIQHKSFQVGDIKVYMEYRNWSNNYNAPLEIHFVNVKTCNYDNIRFWCSDNFKAMGERMVKQAVRELK